ISTENFSVTGRYSSMAWIKHLHDQLSYICKAEALVRGRNVEFFIDHEIERFALFYEFQVIGETMVRLRNDAAPVASLFPEWQDVISFRNVIAHGYDTVQAELVVEIARRDLPTLKRRVIQALEEHDPQGPWRTLVSPPTSE